MPPQAYALVTLFLTCSVLVGILAVRLVARAGGPRGFAAYILPIAGGFGAFYMIGHRLGVVLGPEISLFGFRVAVIGDIAMGFAVAAVVALLQAGLVRAIPGRSASRT